MTDTDLLVADSLLGLSGPITQAQQPAAPSFVIDAETLRARIRAWENDFIGGNALNTVRAVRSGWQKFYGWCERNQRQAIPVSVTDLVQFLEDMVAIGRRRTTIDLYVYAIRTVHQGAQVPDPIDDPLWRQKWKKIRKTLGDTDRDEPRQAEPLLTIHLRQILAVLGDAPRDLRDAALLSLASDTLCRESELATVRYEHLKRTPTGESWTLFVKRSKTDQKGAGSVRYLSDETKQRIDRWCSQHGITEGLLFLPIGGRRKIQQPGKPLPPEHLRPAEIAKIFRRRATQAKIPLATLITGHSTRVGSAVDLSEAGEPLSDIAMTGGWGSEEMVRRYTQQSRAGQNAMKRLRDRQRAAGADSKP